MEILLFFIVACCVFSFKAVVLGMLWAWNSKD